MPHAYRSALVTGASSGIGESLARQLAARGVDLVVVARRAERLDRLADELRDAHRVNVEVLAADLTDATDLAVVEERVADAARPIELLVNNAGFGTSGLFVGLPVDREEDEIRLNVIALMRLTHAALPGMIARGHGGILNVSSMASFVVAPGTATYSATKAFASSFSESVHAEVKPKGVHVTALCPGFTRTEFQSTAGVELPLPKFAWLDRDAVATAGLDAVAAGRAYSIPGIQYKVALPLTKIAPRVMLRSIVSRMWNRT